MTPFRDSSPLLGDVAGLRRRMTEDGYLFLPGLLPRPAVSDVQQRLGTIAREAGWLAADRPVEAAIADPAGFCVDPDTRFLAVLEDINRVFEFHALGHHPALLTFFERFLGDTVLVHPKGLPRFIFPGRPEYTTPAHQDFPNIQGCEDVYTAWIPLIDCPPAVGGLQIAAGSQTMGVLDFDLGNGVGGVEISDPLDGRWVGGPFRAGDVLVFHSMVVHKGIANHSDRLRMSVDIRYQRLGDPFCLRNADKPYGRPDTWEAMAAGWTAAQRAQLFRYWERLPIRPIAFDSRWFDRRDALGFAYGEKGDGRARSVLLRIVARDADPAKRMRAQALLDHMDAT